MPEALITVLVPTYNRRTMLERAVTSVLQESVPLILHIFDNASTDGTETYVRELMASDPRVKYQRQPENLGSWINTRDALKSVATKYFLILADDDWVLPNFLSDSVMIMDSFPDLGGTAFLAEARFASGELETIYPSREKPTPGRREPADHIREFLLKGHYFWSSILWKSEVLSYLGYPYLHAGLPSDIDLQAQIFCRYPIYVVDRPGAVFFRHDDQSALGFNLEHILDWATFFRRLDRKIAETGLIPKEEYVQLRRIAVNRYRAGWRKKIDTYPLTDKIQIMKFYSAAAFSIGDIELADHLINRLNAEIAK